MGIRLSKFIVDLPQARFSRRIILSPKEARLRDRIAKKMNRQVEAEVLRRRHAPDRCFDWDRSESSIRRELKEQVIYELANKRQIYTAAEAQIKGRITPSNVTYEQVLGSNKPLLADPPRLRTAADYFLDYLNHRRLDENLVKKFPLLAAFLDAARTNEEHEHDFQREEVLARAGASERALCAGLLGRYLKPEQSMLVSPAEIMNCGSRLGIDQAFLSQEIDKVLKIYITFSQAMGLTLQNLSQLTYQLSSHKKFLDRVFPETHKSEYEVKTSDDQIINFINLTRALLADRDSRLLYAAQNLCGLRSLAKERLAQAEGKGEEEILKQPLTTDQPFNFLFYQREEVGRLQYFLQVIPVVEELNIPYLTDALKEAYFMAYKPEEYLKVSYQLGRVLRFHHQWEREKGEVRFSQAAAQKHVDNIIRLIREVGMVTGLLPEGAEVKGRVKSHWSAHEKFINSPGLNGPPLYDILAFRILVNDPSDIRKVAYLMFKTFLKAGSQPKRQAGEYLVYPYVPKPLEEYLEGLKKDLESGKLYKSDYRRGIKNTLGTDIGVQYYQMILLTYFWLPMHVQITTHKLEEGNEAQAPHWEYKFLRQLKLRGLGQGIERGAFTVPTDRVLVCVIDEATQTIRAESIPKEQATLADHPEYRWVITEQGKLASKQERPGDMVFRNGTLLYKPTKFYVPSKIYVAGGAGKDDDPFIFPEEK